MGSVFYKQLLWPTEEICLNRLVFRVHPCHSLTQSLKLKARVLKLLCKVRCYFTVKEIYCLGLSRWVTMTKNPSPVNVFAVLWSWLILPSWLSAPCTLWTQTEFWWYTVQCVVMFPPLANTSFIPEGYMLLWWWIAQVRTRRYESSAVLLQVWSHIRVSSRVLLEKHMREFENQWVKMEQGRSAPFLITLALLILP